RREFIRLGMAGETPGMKKKLGRYWASLEEVGLRRTHVALDFVGGWHLRTKARVSEYFKELLKDKSLTDPAGGTDSDTTRSLFQTVSNEPLASLRPREKIS